MSPTHKSKNQFLSVPLVRDLIIKYYYNNKQLTNEIAQIQNRLILEVLEKQGAVQY